MHCSFGLVKAIELSFILITLGHGPTGQQALSSNRILKCLFGSFKDIH